MCRNLVRLALSGAILLTLAGCLLTMGAPLMRRVEPGKWTLEAGGGLTTTGGVGHAYVGHALESTSRSG